MDTDGALDGPPPDVTPYILWSAAHNTMIYILWLFCKRHKYGSLYQIREVGERAD